jgi:subtilase family serine protease
LTHFSITNVFGGLMEKISRQKRVIQLVLMSCVALLAIMATVTTYNVSSVSAAPKSGRHTLPGHVAPILAHYKSAARAMSKNNQLQLSISLNLRNRPALTALLAAQSDPTSASYHHYLTPQEFTDTFGPTQDTVNSVVVYLQGQGLHVTSVAPNNMLVNVTGSVATAEQAFGVTLSTYQVAGRSVYAPSADPSVPDALGAAILDIGGLDNLTTYHHAGITQQNKQATGPGKGYTPSELRTAYNMNTLMSNGGTGAGQKVALFELDGYNPSDISTYLDYYHLGAPKYSNVLVDGATTTPGDGAIEVELDMEVMSALAPDAAQKIYIGQNSLPGVNDLYNKIVTDNQVKVTSISWGVCEQNSGSAELITLDNIFAQGAAQGQAFFAASGDYGAYDCQDGSTLAVDSPADDPSVVGVGGTNLHLGGDGSYSSETVWGNEDRGEGGGGGVSTVFTRPAYQKGPHLTNLNRQVPDVSADADPLTGYSLYCTLDNTICGTGWSYVGGTSAAAPLWAALATDANEYLAHQGKTSLGSASNSLYALYNTPQPYSAYHDVTTGTNLYYQAGPGYDMASGIGTPDAWNIARDLAQLPSNGASASTQLLKNPGFDQARESWTESASGAYEIVNTTRPHAGGMSADICAYATCNDRISQSVTLPANLKKVVLSYWVYVNSQTTSHTCFDYLSTSLLNSHRATIITPQTLCNTQTKGWKKYSFDVTTALTKYAGKSITVDFHGTTTNTSATEFFVDDIALTVTHR